MTNSNSIVVGKRTDAADPTAWKTYDEFAAGIDTYRLRSTDLTGRSFSLTFEGGLSLSLSFIDDETVQWSSDGLLSAVGGNHDPYDAVEARPGVFFVNLPLESRSREAITIVWNDVSGRAMLAHSVIAPEAVRDTPQVGQTFAVGTIDGVEVTGAKPGPSRDLIGMRNNYRYSPNHLYEHVYLSSQRYAWQCVQGEQRGHGDVDMSTVWKFEHGLYLFCFREFVIPVASVWLHDLGYELRTTGVFLGINGDGEAQHSRAGGHIYPLGSVTYPDIQPV